MAFRLAYDAGSIDPNATYSLQAEVVDGENAWTTGAGVTVIPNGRSAVPVALVLAYRPDLVKGEVTGSLTGASLTPPESAFTVAVLVAPATGQSLGMDLLPKVGTVPVPFSIPFPLAAIDPATDYLVGAQIVDPVRTWQNEAGVPVITRGNPIADVQVVVAEAGAARPSATPIPAPSPVIGGPGGTIGPGILLVVAALIVGGAGILIYDRSRFYGPGRPLPADQGPQPDLTIVSEDSPLGSTDSAPSGTDPAPGGSDPATGGSDPAPGGDAPPASDDATVARDSNT